VSAKTLQELEQKALKQEQQSLKKIKVNKKKIKKARKKKSWRAAAKKILLENKKQQTPQQLAFLQKELAGEMVTIKGSCFQLGSPETEKDRDLDEKQHLVCMSDFEIGRYELTKAKFAAFVSATHYLTQAEKTDGCNGWDGRSWKKDKQYSWRNPGFAQTETDPVTCVSWNDAIAYTHWLSAQTGQKYRLPTEAEWEYAARANTTTRYPWSNEIEANRSNCYKDSCKDNYPYTAPVGSFNAYNGLYDMHGNVWEWTCSEYDYNYNDKDQQCLAKNHANKSIVVRGGSWLDLQEKSRSASRDGWDASDRGLNLGFRIARSL
jgi:serine/threonine-protein kinase PpkA